MQWLVKRWALIAAVAIGAMVGFLSTKWSFFTISYSFDVSDILSLLVTTVVGLYIAHIVQSKQTASRLEQDLVIEHVKGMQARLKSLAFEQGSSKLLWHEQVAWFGNWFGEIESLTCLVQEIAWLNCVGKETDELFKESLSLKSLATGGEKKSDRFFRDEVDCKNFNASKRKIEQTLYGLVITINRKG